MGKMNDDKMKEILFKHGLDKLLTEVKKHISDGYWQAYRDGYITGQGIGYQDGKYNGYAKAVQTIIKGRY